jgi:hypothetical protein
LKRFSNEMSQPAEKKLLTARLNHAYPSNANEHHKLLPINNFLASTSPTSTAVSVCVGVAGNGMTLFGRLPRDLVLGYMLYLWFHEMVNLFGVSKYHGSYIMDHLTHITTLHIRGSPVRAAAILRTCQHLRRLKCHERTIIHIPRPAGHGYISSAPPPPIDDAVVIVTACGPKLHHLDLQLIGAKYQRQAEVFLNLGWFIFISSFVIMTHFIGVA